MNHKTTDPETSGETDGEEVHVVAQRNESNSRIVGDNRDLFSGKSAAGNPEGNSNNGTDHPSSSYYYTFHQHMMLPPRGGPPFPGIPAPSGRMYPPFMMNPMPPMANPLPNS